MIINEISHKKLSRLLKIYFSFRNFNTVGKILDLASKSDQI